MIRKLIHAFLIAVIAAVMSSCAGGDARSENGTNNSSSKDEIKKKDNKQDDEGSEEKEERIPVETTTTIAGDISAYLLLSSNLETEKMTDVYSRVQGLVEKILVEEGDYVKKGQLLMQLEPDELALEEARARVDFEQEENLYGRKQAMFNKQLLSKEQFEMARFALDAKRIAWQKAKLNLDHTNITSPISGVIGERLRRPGDRIQPSDKLFTVINNEEMIVVVHVPEKEVGRIEKGQKAFITSQHLGDEQFEGWIKRVSPVVDPQSGTFKVTVGIRNEHKQLRPGMFVNVHIITETHTNTVLIPKTAILYENENMFVFVVRDSIACKIALDAGFQDYEKIEVRSAIEVGENVIVVGQAGLKDSTRVNIVAERANLLQTKAGQ
ncbi:MAG: efflux RND transporter periplasmic adaptor subunit [bacterium]